MGSGVKPLLQDGLSWFAQSATQVSISRFQFSKSASGGNTAFEDDQGDAEIVFALTQSVFHI